MTASIRWILAVTRAGARQTADAASISVGRALSRAGTKLLLYPHRSERVDVPATIERDGKRVDVIEDLIEYTGLDRDQVVGLIRRRHESFRAEWHALPLAVRSEAWFYLSSRTYLFANASHDAEELANDLTSFLPNSGNVLEFGGGTGNLAIALATRGHRVDYVERSALQKDFVRFRLEKHGLEEQIRVLDQWMPLAAGVYDLVCAMDVLEHIESVGETVAGVLRSIRPGGFLAESSPFVRNSSNPMHHETEADFVRLMQQEDFTRVQRGERFQLWRAEGAPKS